MLKSNAVAITLPIGKKMISRYRGFSENEAIVMIRKGRLLMLYS
jgi:hypothetical protein